MEIGFIKIHRKLLDWQWYKSSNHFHLFIHLILSANYKDSTWRKENLQRGQLLTGRKQLSLETTISEQSIRTILNDLKSTNEITIKSTSKYSIITIVNYNLYQPANQQINQQSTSNQPAANHIQEVKEYKESKEIDSKQVLLTENTKLIITYLNTKLNKKFQCTKDVVTLIARIYKERSDTSLQLFYEIIDMKIKEWINDPVMYKRLVPNTLFAWTNFSKYINQLMMEYDMSEEEVNNVNVNQ